MSEVRNADSTAEFAPVVTGLQEVDNSDALKKIKTVYEQRSLLYFFSKEKTNWITRGKGNIRIQKHDESQFYQMVLYEEKTLKLRLCTIIHPANEMKANEGSDRAWAFACTDYSESEDGKGNVQACVIKFKNSEIADKFKAEYEKYQKVNGEAAKKGESKKPEEAKKEEAKKEEAKKEDKAAAAPATA
uniref:RanBD1 domain-containing protein n=1 Tax=Lotharella oceanica TaxID=641309 RepID=A0A7S2TKH1_9EUKA|mmetsp:Transcript_18447/g.34821  ORF Transcript_18447/g.34821 Transcript_18447/m.34821 type:complete len:188 (+) Transcript_18447:71-634(+)|eukprot:CAMPEP_0170175982 /NCGR_PEP_ID=MMETSP0040_2-20121228/8947_1 /TAXON_ID=641309 /ORGANISM="Lotharella oceanica, Strain CCMP622" /LENGTH=187 /DNA_ID=CAMNT_0010418153 /DNA_START=53 /DNA_END=616 /DNA_ORIENTATION=+